MATRIPDDGNDSNVSGQSEYVTKLFNFKISPTVYLQHLVRIVTVSVTGTEGSAFVISRVNNKVDVHNLVHIRPKGAEEDLRTEALSAMKKMAVTCIKQGKSGIILINEKELDADNKQQYCLVPLLYAEGQLIGACCIITSCENHQEASKELLTAQVISAYFSLYSEKNKEWWKK